MANVGEQLLQPESGMQRIDDSNLNIKYIGDGILYSNDNRYYNNTRTTLTKSTDKIKFYIYSSSISIIAPIANDTSDNVIINIDGTEYNFNCYNGQLSANVPIFQALAFKKTGLNKSIHEVTIYIKSILSFVFDAIDIDEDGYMLYCDDNGKLYYDVTPIMTSNTTPAPYVVSYSGLYGRDATSYGAFDGTIDKKKFIFNISTGWLKFDFNLKKRITAFNLYINNKDTTNMKHFKLFGSNDDILYDELYELSLESNTWVVGNNIFKFNKINEYRYYKLESLGNFGASGTTIAELRYLLAVDTPFYLIKDNVDNKIYNYDEENNQLVEVTDTSILKDDALNNTCIYDLSKTVPLLDTLSDDLTILCNNNKKIIAKGIKSNKELIIGKNSFSTKIARNIDYFQLDENATAKIIFSIDDGATWKTYNTSTNTFEDLSISIPVNKDYSNFTDEEKTAWEEAKETAYNQGIDSSILNTINFNDFDSEKMKFGYVLTATDSETMDKMKNLIWQFDSKGVMELVSPSDVKQQLFYGGVKLISNIDADMLKVNITYEGIDGSGGTATSLDINRTVEEIQSDIDSIF